MSGSYVYILGLGSDTGTLYICVTSNLYVRVMQHKEGTLEGFTAKSSEQQAQDKHRRGPSTPRH